MLRGIANYYSFVHNYGSLVGTLTLILKSSCAKLLAAKYKLETQSKAFAKFGKDLRCPTSNATFEKLSHVITLEFKTQPTPKVPTLFGSKSLATLDDLSCTVCGSKHRVEMHHVRAMRDLEPNRSLADRLMVKANRKQIPLCRKCHMERHEQAEADKKRSHRDKKLT